MGNKVDLFDVISHFFWKPSIGDSQNQRASFVVDGTVAVATSQIFHNSQLVCFSHPKNAFLIASPAIFICY